MVKFNVHLRMSAAKLFLGLAIIFIFSGNKSPAQEFSTNAPQVDPFYLRLFDEGKQAFAQGEMEEAFQNFKLAAFGFLDAPELLGEALVYLTVTAYNLKKSDLVKHYLEEISRLKLNNKILSSNLPLELKEKFTRIQSDFKNGLKG